MKLAAANALLDRGDGRPPAAMLVQADVKHEVVYQRLEDVISDLEKSGIPLDLPDLTGLTGKDHDHRERTADESSADRQPADRENPDQQGGGQVP